MAQSYHVFYLICLGVFGLLFGSFGNVLIWRVPRGESIVSPPSHCPSCGHDVRWHDNVPMLSWLVLRGRCRDCGEPISIRYLVVEATSGLLFVVAGWFWGFGPATPLAVAFLYLLLVLSVIDLDTRRLPTPLVYALALVAAVAAVAAQITGLPFGPLTQPTGSGWLSQPLVFATIGLAAGVGVSLAVAFVYRVARGRDGLGFGDVRLLGAMGLALGPFVLLAYGLANILGVLVAVPQTLLTRGKEGLAARSIPFGPFLAAGGVLTALWGPAIWTWYLRLLGVA